MNVGELRMILEELGDLDDAVEVRIAHQPSWPFEYEIDARSFAVVAKRRCAIHPRLGCRLGLGHLPGEHPHPQVVLLLR